MITRRRAFRRIATGLALASAACARGDRAPDEASGFSGETWTATEELRIGSVDDPVYGLTTVVGVAVAPDGGLFSLHRQSPFLRRWAPDGSHVEDLGQEGRGPGEFEGPRRIGFFGDSLWVYDRNRRLTWFDQEGNLLGTATPAVDLGEAGTEASELPARPEAPLPDGTWWGRLPAFSNAVAAGDLTRVPHVRMTSEGETLDTVWVRHIRDRGRHRTLAIEWGGGGMYSSQPLADGPFVVADEARGAFYILERWAAPEGAATADWSVHRLDLGGDTVWSRHLTYRPDPVPSAFTDSLVKVMEERFAPIVERTGLPPDEVRRGVVDALYLPAHHPPIEHAVAGRDGTFWVALRPGSDDGIAEDRDPTGRTRPWYVFADDGADLARLRLPADLEVLAADRTAVWGTVTDELDISYLVRFRIEG